MNSSLRQAVCYYHLEGDNAIASGWTWSRN